MNRSEFCLAFAKKHNTTIGNAEDICCKVFDFLSECIEKECSEGKGRIYIKGLGTFKGEKVKSHNIRDVNSGQMMVLPEKIKVKFEQTVPTIREVVTPACAAIPSYKVDDRVSVEELVRRILSEIYPNQPVTPTKTQQLRVAPKKKLYQHKVLPTKVCAHCGQSFKPVNGIQRYCSISCREQFYADVRRAISNSTRASANKSVTINL